MTFKKVMSAVMAGAMVLSMGMTAFATGTPSGQIDLEGEAGYDVEVGSSTQVATIKVQVPEVVGFIVNPYKLDAKNDELGITNTGDTQIVSPLQKIVNKSDFKIKVGGKIFAYENNPEETTLKADGSAFDAGKKQAIISFLAKAGTAADTTRLTAASTPDDTVDLSTAKVDTGAALTDVTIDETGGAKPAYTFNFDGTAQETPEFAWTEADTFGATISFTFTAVANAGGSSSTAASVSLDNPTLNVANGGTGTLNATYSAGTSGLTVTKYEWASDATSVATVTAGGTVSDTSTTVTWASAGTANVTVTVTLSDNSTVTATCVVTCAS